MEEKLEYKIGEIVTINNEKYLVTESKDIYDCLPCDLFGKCCQGAYLGRTGRCAEDTRSDKKGVIYKRVE